MCHFATRSKRVNPRRSSSELFPFFVIWAPQWHVHVGEARVQEASESRLFSSVFPSDVPTNLSWQSKPESTQKVQQTAKLTAIRGDDVEVTAIDILTVPFGAS